MAESTPQALKTLQSCIAELGEIAARAPRGCHTHIRSQNARARLNNPRIRSIISSHSGAIKLSKELHDHILQLKFALPSSNTNVVNLGENVMNWNFYNIDNTTDNLYDLSIPSGPSRERPGKDYSQLKASFIQKLSELEGVPENIRKAFRIDSDVVGWDEGIALGALDCLWDEIPILESSGEQVLVSRVNSNSQFDGAFFQDEDMKDVETVLSSLCDAFISLLEPLSEAADSPAYDPRKLEFLRHSSKIVLILSVISGGRLWLDRFVKKQQHDDMIPYEGEYDENKLLGVLNNSSDVELFLGQQYRVHERPWPPDKPMDCHRFEPLRIRVGERYGRGYFAEVHKVTLVTKDGNGKHFARKLHTMTTDESFTYYQREESLLRQISADCERYHIVKLIKTYRRDLEIGLLLSPAARTDLTAELELYARSSNPDQIEKKPILLRAIGCLSIGLWWLHESKKTIHGHIKTKNALLHFKTRPEMEEADEFLWTDLGLSSNFKNSNINPKDTKEHDHSVYQPPEQNYDFHSDIYSFGCVILEVLNTLLGRPMDHNNKESIFSLRDYYKHLDDLQKWINIAKNDRKLKKNDSIYRLLGLASKMVQRDCTGRPSATNMVCLLRKISKSYGNRLFCSNCESIMSNEESFSKLNSVISRSKNTFMRNFGNYSTGTAATAIESNRGSTSTGVERIGAVDLRKGSTASYSENIKRADRAGTFV